MSETPVLGRDCNLGIGIEGTEGDAAAPTLWFDITEESCTSDMQLYETQSLGGREKMDVPAVPAKEDNKFGFTCEPRFNHLGVLFGLAMGGAVAGNTYEPGNSPKSITVEVDKVAELETGKSVEQYAGGKVTKITLTSEANKALMIKVEGVARTCLVVTGTPPDKSAWISKAPMMHHGMSMTSGPTEIKDSPFYKVEMEMTGGVEEDHFANALTRIASPAGQFAVTGKLAIPFNDVTAKMRDKIKKGTRFDATLRWLGSGAETLDIALSAKAKGPMPTFGGPESVQMELEFEGYAAVGGHTATVTLGS